MSSVKALQHTVFCALCPQQQLSNTLYSVPSVLSNNSPTHCILCPLSSTLQHTVFCALCPQQQLSNTLYSVPSVLSNNSPTHCILCPLSSATTLQHTVFCAAYLTAPYVVPAVFMSSSTERLQVFFCLLTLHFSCGFHSRALRVTFSPDFPRACSSHHPPSPSSRHPLLSSSNFL